MQRIHPGLLPELQVVLALTVEGTRRKNVWLLLEPNAAPSACLEDPDLALERYMYVEADADRLLPIAQGRVLGRPRSARATSGCSANPSSFERCPVGSGPPIGKARRYRA
jgi:hypothetical protein